MYLEAWSRYFHFTDLIMGGPNINKGVWIYIHIDTALAAAAEKPISFYLSRGSGTCKLVSTVCFEHD